MTQEQTSTVSTPDVSRAIVEELALHSEGRVRWAVVDAIRKQGSVAKEFETLLINLALRDRDPDGVQRSAAQALHELLGTEFLPQIQRMLTSTNRTIQAGACSILSEYGEDGASIVPMLIPFLRDKDLLVRSPAGEALVAMAPASIPALITSMQTDEDAVDLLGGAMAQSMVERFPDQNQNPYLIQVIPALLTLWEKEGNNVYPGVAYSLYQAVSVYGYTPLLATMEPMLLDALQARTNGYAFVQWISMAGDKLTPCLRRGLERETSRGYSALALDIIDRAANSPATGHMIPHLIRTLDEEKDGNSWELVGATIWALKEHGSEAVAAEKLLVHYLKNGAPNQSYRIAAASALSDIGQPEQVLPILRQLEAEGGIGDRLRREIVAAIEELERKRNNM